MAMRVMGGMADAMMIMIGVGEGVLDFEIHLIWFCFSRRWQRESHGVFFDEYVLDIWT
jgi:hypothetical protein